MPFVQNLITANPVAGTATCEIDAGTPTVACPADSGFCPACPACPAPACPTPVVNGVLGTCRKCKVKGGVTKCVGCPVTLQ